MCPMSIVQVDKWSPYVIGASIMWRSVSCSYKDTISWSPCVKQETIYGPSPVFRRWFCIGMDCERQFSSSSLLKQCSIFAADSADKRSAGNCKKINDYFGVTASSPSRAKSEQNPQNYSTVVSQQNVQLKNSIVDSGIASSLLKCIISTSLPHQSESFYDSALSSSRSQP